MMRTYAGHSDARRSNELYRRNLEKGQTGLSIAFDLPTQTGYDPDHELARGEVGKVGVSIAHEGDMRTLLDGIPLDQMNTSMTINATAAWLLALYIVAAEEQGVASESAPGHHPERHPQGVPEPRHLRVPARPQHAADRRHDRLHGRSTSPSGTRSTSAPTTSRRPARRPVQEIAYAMSNAIAVLDAVRERVPEDLMGSVFGRISFFVNAGVRFVEEHAKLRAMAQLWDELGRERYGVEDDKHRRFRYGVQVNSLGLTEAQPENNVYRIALEALAVTLGRNARARAIQLPAWNEALGLPRPWDQQWSLRLQQILAYETDLLEYPDIFEGSKVMDGPRRRAGRGRPRGDGARGRARRRGRGRGLHEVRAGRVPPRALAQDRVRRADRRGHEPLRSPPSPRRSPPMPTAASWSSIPRSRPSSARRWSSGALERDSGSGRRGPGGARPRRPRRLREHHARDHRRRPRRRHHRRVGADPARGRSASTARPPAWATPPPRPARSLTEVRDEVERVSEALGRRLKFLVGKPGLDGHSNGAEQIAVRARDAGMDVVYEGIRLTPSQIASSAAQEGVHVIGLSILSGSHAELIPSVLEALREAGVEDVPVVVGGIIPEADAAALREAGVAAVYTPKDWDLNGMMRDIVALVAERNGVDTAAPA